MPKPLFLFQAHHCRFLLVFLLAFNSCRKPIPEANPDLVGYWVNTSHCQDQITIWNDGTGNYRVRGVQNECKSGERTQGDAILIRGKIIKIHNTRFEIISPPTPMDTMDIEVDSVQSYIGKSVMSMVLQKSIFNGHKTFTFYKIIGK
jgi:hypothetical protein